MPCIIHQCVLRLSAKIAQRPAIGVIATVLAGFLSTRRFIYRVTRVSVKKEQELAEVSGEGAGVAFLGGAARTLAVCHLGDYLSAVSSLPSVRPPKMFS